MESEREYLENDYDKICDIFCPALMRFSDKKDAIEKGILGCNIHEGTGAWAADLMRNGFQGNISSQAIPWLNYEMDDKVFRGVDRVNHWLQDFRDHMLSVYGENGSNYYDGVNEWTGHGITVGSPVIIPEVDHETGKIQYIIPHPATRYFKQNRFGVTDTLHLKDLWNVREAVKEFGYDNLSEGVQKAYDEGNDDKKVKIIQAYYFHLDRIFKGLPANKDGTKYHLRWPWVKITVEEDAGQAEEDQKPLSIDLL